MELFSMTRGTRYETVALSALLLAGVSALVAGCSSESNRHQARPLRVVGTPTTRFVASFYDAGGTYPQVRLPGTRLSRVNAAIRHAIAADQRRYAAGVGDWMHDGACGGIYVTSIDPQLISASTAVVSALLPALELYPCGNDGRGWVSMTIRVPSGRRLGLTDLFARPNQGLSVVAAAWRERFRRQDVGRILLHAYPRDFRTEAFRHAFFALTPSGLAIGFWQDGPTDRLHAIVPYDVVRPHLSELGATLVAGVQRPTFGGRSPRADFRRPPVMLPGRVHTFFKGTGRGAAECELADGVPHLPAFVLCLAAATPARAVRVELTRTRMRVCHGSRCVSNAPENVKTLGNGEYIASKSFTCVSIRGAIRCWADPGPAGFLLGVRGLRLCRGPGQLAGLFCARQ